MSGFFSKAVQYVSKIPIPFLFSTEPIDIAGTSLYLHAISLVKFLTETDFIRYAKLIIGHSLKFFGEKQLISTKE